MRSETNLQDRKPPVHPERRPPVHSERSRGIALLALALVGCGSLTPPRPDGGTGGGFFPFGGGQGTGGGLATGGGGGGGTATGGGIATGGGGGTTTGGGGGAELPWTEVALQVPINTPGTVQRLAARPGEIFALVANQYVLRSAGGRFNEVLVFANPVLTDFQFSTTGNAALAVFREVLTCTSGCASGSAFNPIGFNSTPFAVCGSADSLGVMTFSSDAGAALFEQTTTAWSFVSQVNVRSPADCVRTTRGDLFVAGQGGVANANLTQSLVEVPDTTALGRASANEPWSRLATDGTSVYATSSRGAVATRPQAGGWVVDTALSGEISAIAVESASEIWVVGTGLGLARFNGTQWRPAGLGPPQLTTFDALALESAHVYVGGHDAAGVARVFRRLR